MIRMTIKRNEHTERKFPDKPWIMGNTREQLDRALDIAKGSQRKEWIDAIKAGHSINVRIGFSESYEITPQELELKRGAWCSVPNYETHRKVSARPGESYQVPCKRSATHTWTDRFGYKKPMCQDHTKRHIRAYGDRKIVARF